jgi:hypothetical protein
MFGSDYDFLAFSIPPTTSSQLHDRAESLGVEQTEENFLIEFHHFE